jgi:hypothetical protein
MSISLSSIKKAIAAGGEDKTFAEFISELFADKYVEIYLGENLQVAKLDQTETLIPSVLCGKVVGAFKNCLILNSFKVSDDAISLGNIIFINEINIKALTEVDNNGTIGASFNSSKKSQKIKKLTFNE